MVNFFWAIGASIVVSLVSLIGILTLLIRESWLSKALVTLIGFSAGGLIGGAFLHILPEALEQSRDANIFLPVILGLIFFFMLERYFHWRHCHDGVCDVHAFTYLNLIGDSIHNFTDGLIIGASFILDIRFGIITTLVVILHEIPQEIGDFGVLVYGGMKRARALFYNFISALACILGTVCGYYLSERIARFSLFLLPFTAGGFIYIAACDLIPELHKQSKFKETTFSMLSFLAGIFFVLLAKAIHAH